MGAVADLLADAQADETLPGPTDTELFQVLIDVTWALAVRRGFSFGAVAMALLCEGPSERYWRGLKYRTRFYTRDVIRAGLQRLTQLLGPKACHDGEVSREQ